MSISFEEVTAEVTPDRAEEAAEGGRPQGEAAGSPLSERIRAVLAREKHRAERLSDR